MESEKNVITVRTTVDAPVEKVWFFWTNPDFIIKWNNASDDWHTTKAENNLIVGGKFSSRMEAKDGSEGFDFWGTYDEIVYPERITYTMGDGRKAEIDFIDISDMTEIIEAFEAETENSLELQQGGWQSILDNFKKLVESEN